MSILGLIKVVSQSAHVEDFLDGRLYMNTLSYFALLEGDLTGRHDPNEGTAGWYQPDKVSLILNDVPIPSSELAAPLVVHYNTVLNRNAFCLYSLNSRGFDTISAETLPDLKRHFELPSSCFALGHLCVVVLNPSAFIERCCLAIRQHGFKGRLGLVDYFDEATFHGSIPDEEQGFHKSRAFAHQREYRIVVETLQTPARPFTLEVGSLRDIAVPMAPADFNEGLKLRLPDGSVA